MGLGKTFEGLSLALVLTLVISGLSFVMSPLAFAADIKRGYVDTSGGQIHYRRASPRSDVAAKIPLFFFHPSAKSGQIFDYVLRDMGNDRVAIALDTPGFGGSDALKKSPSAKKVAKIMAEAIEAFGYGTRGGGQVDVFGFHTGSVIVTELTRLRPDLVRRSVLSGLPLRSTQDRKLYYDNVKRGRPFNKDMVEYVWETVIETREDHVSLEDAAETFSENIRALAGPWWHAYDFVWSYPLDKRLPDVNAPTTLILNPPDMEYDPTREAFEKFIPKAAYVDLPQVTNMYHPFIPYWEIWNKALRQWLDAPVPQ